MNIFDVKGVSTCFIRASLKSFRNSILRGVNVFRHSGTLYITVATLFGGGASFTAVTGFLETQKLDF